MTGNKACLYNTKQMRRAVPKIEWLWILSLLCKEMHVSLFKHKVMCSCLMRQLKQSLLNHMGTQVNTFSNAPLPPSLGDLINQWLEAWNS